MLAHATSQMRACPWTSSAFMVLRDTKKLPCGVWASSPATTCSRGIAFRRAVGNRGGASCSRRFITLSIFLRSSAICLCARVSRIGSGRIPGEAAQAVFEAHDLSIRSRICKAASLADGPTSSKGPTHMGQPCSHWHEVMTDRTACISSSCLSKRFSENPMPPG